MEKFIIQVATDKHLHYAEIISRYIENASMVKGAGLAKRTPEYISEKMKQNNAVIATTREGQWAGFCYIETFSNNLYIVNSGLIVVSEFRKSGLGKMIKKKIFDLSVERYPNAKIFGLATGLAVMKINSELGYNPVTYSELTKDYQFWKGCESCTNYDILERKQWENCLCTAMIFDPAVKMKNKNGSKENNFVKNIKLYERWMRFKIYVFLQNKSEHDESMNAGINKKDNKYVKK
ncbi:MAG: GNAT family N-acetyltransferase [Bacteroidales bacterium]|nr:GNAT family N-acetyltransferase [Bacteroidales bacterium]